MGSPEIVRALALIVLFAVMSKGSQADEGPCKPAIAQLVSALGQVDTQFARRATWQPAVLNQDYCVEDRVRTGDLSRAVLAIMEGIATRLSLNQNTLVNFVTVADRAILSVEYGDVHVRSHTPRHFDVTTKFVNAGIEGTEFLVSTTDKQAEVTVFEGTVQLTNPHGRLTLKKGQSAIARTGQAPQIKLLLKPIDAVEWALYYPPIIDTGALLHSERQPALRHAVTLYQSGHIAEAFAALEPVPESERTGGEYLGFKAGLLLSAGQVEPAAALIHQALRDNPSDATAKSLLAMIALARNDKERALALAKEASTLAPRSPVPLLALSYAEQARFDLPQAREAVEAALRLDPDNDLAHVRHAELLASLGERAKARQAAERAVALNPRLARAHSVLGFTQLMEADTDKAIQSFRHAIELDASDPLAHFGLGLARIRGGELEQGTEDIEIAGSLDPNDSLIRSYLGKAYYEQKRSKLADSQFELAKQYDPKDPTPHFYDAIKKQTENRPVAALHDLQQAINLNGNRAVYRSKQTLDSDLAARSAAIGRIYSDLGFSQRALVEGWNSVAADPTDYTGHRLLADSYSALPRHELARTGELWLSQLLQPLSLTPVQPQLAESNRLFLTGEGPQHPSFTEFNPAFTRDRLALQASGLVASNGTYSDEVIQSGIKGPVSYSLGQFHYDTQGFRPNNALRQDIYNVFIQGQLTNALSTVFEARHKEVDYGDLLYDLDLRNIYDPTVRTHLQSDVVRLGLNQSISDHSHLIGSLTYERRRNVMPDVATEAFSSYLSQAQYISHHDTADVVLGGGHLHIATRSDYPDGFTETAPNNYSHAYLYSNIRIPLNITTTIGVSYDNIREKSLPKLEDFNSINPKIGLIWRPTENLTFRAALFNAVRRGILLMDHTIEPSQIAGFSQFYNDRTGTKSRTYGAGLDYRLAPTSFAGLELSRRELSVVDFSGLRAAWDERTYRAYFNWASEQGIAVSLSYNFEDFDTTYFRTRAHMAPLKIKLFSESGFLGSIGATYVDQFVFLNDGEIDHVSNNRFFLLDAGLGYRLPKRYGIVQFGVKNLLDERFNYFGSFIRTNQEIGGEANPLFIPGRWFFGQITLAF